MPIELQRTGFDLAPKNTDWWWRTRRGVLSATVDVEMSQARAQIVYTSPFPVRFLHDPWLSLAAVGDTKATLGHGEFDPFILGVSVAVVVNARGSVVDGIDYPPVDEDIGWTGSGTGLRLPNTPFGTLTVGPGTYTQLSGPLFDRALWDQEGTFDFVRLNLQVTTSGNFAGKVNVTAGLWANEQVLAIYPGTPPGILTHSHLQTGVLTGEAL